MHPPSLLQATSSRCQPTSLCWPQPQYFRSYLARWAPAQGAAAGPPQLVEHCAPDELQAAAAVVKLMYTGQVKEGDAAAGDVDTLLQVGAGCSRGITLGDEAGQMGIALPR